MSVILAAGALYFYQKEREERYGGKSFIPERSEDVPLYLGLKPHRDPGYTIEGDHWQEVLSFYKKVLPENGWTEIFIQSSDQPEEDGAGFISAWQKEGQEWELAINGAYFENMDQTEVIFDKIEKMTSTKWIENQPEAICINEQPDRSKDCFEMTDEQTITQIIGLVNGANDLQKEEILYEGKSKIDFGSLTVEVFYDLDKGIYLVSEKGTKWLKPEKEFFVLTRISKEY